MLPYEQAYKEFYGPTFSTLYLDRDGKEETILLCSAASEFSRVEDAFSWQVQSMRLSSETMPQQGDVKQLVTDQTWLSIPPAFEAPELYRRIGIFLRAVRASYCVLTTVTDAELTMKREFWVIATTGAEGRGVRWEVEYKLFGPRVISDPEGYELAAPPEIVEALQANADEAA